MSIAEILSSGILTDYCLGLLSEHEKQQVEELSLKCEPIAAELQLLQKGLELYASKKTSWRNDNLRLKIWQTIEKMNNDEAV